MAKIVNGQTAPAPARPQRKPRRALYPDARGASHRRYRAVARLSGGLLKAGLIALALAAAAALPGAAQDRLIKEVGVGVVAGAPVGATAKLWLNPDYAVDLGIGYSGSTVLWGDFLYHAWNILPQPREGKLGVYFGAGPRLVTATDAEFGVRTLAGVSWRLKSRPLEFFAEAGPVFRLTQGGGVEADGGVGVRLFLGSPRR